MEHSKHIWRAALILLFGVVGFIVVRQFLIPKSFGIAGHYRFDALAEFMAQPVKHGGRESCRKCHEPPYETTSKGKHARVSCEVCHGPVGDHASKEAKIAVMPKNPSYKLCAYCHQKLAARPKGFKQVSFRKHLEEQGFASDSKIPEKICLKCHEPHDPTGAAGN
ncbi:MAG: cytochrome C [Planctomycetes bacterium]|nr:cytochrome C [Planctomycetota bacterium]